MPGNLRIFISHASRDKATVSRLERTLTQWGLRPWVDQQGLAGGQRWSAELQRAIASSTAVVLIVTPASLASEMVRREYAEALRQRIPVILLVLRHVPSVPAELSGLPCIDWTHKKWLGEERLFLALYDLGIRPEEQRDVLGSPWPAHLLLSNEGRGAEGWRRYTVKRGTYARLSSIYIFVLVVCIGASVSPLLTFLDATTFAPAMKSTITALSEALAIPVMFLFIVAQRLVVSQAVAFICYYVAAWPPEAVLLTEASVSTNLFRFRWARAGVEQRHYPFAAIEAIEVRRTRFGNVLLDLRSRDGASNTSVWLPRRLARPQAVAADICQAVHTYQASQPSALSDDHAPARTEAVQAVTSAPATLAASPERARRFVVLAGEENLPVVGSIQQHLAWRGVYMAECVRVPAEGVTMPTASGAAQAGFALVFLAPAVLRSPRLQSIVSDLLARHVLVIPIIVAANVQMPPLLAQLQWVDWSPNVDPQRSRCDLLNALDAAGVPLMAPAECVDGELVMGRAMHDRALPDWDVFKVNPLTRPVYRMYRMYQFLPSAGLGYGLIVLLTFLPVTGLLFASHSTTSLSDLSSWKVPFILLMAVLGLALLGNGLRSYRRKLAAGGALKRLIRNTAVPEMIVVTPAGIVVHIMDVRTRRFEDKVLPFAVIRKIERRRGYYTPIRLRCRLWDGRTVEFGLPGYLLSADGAANAIQRYWLMYQGQHRALATAPAIG